MRFSWKVSPSLSLVCFRVILKFSITDGAKKQRESLDPSLEYEKLHMLWLKSGACEKILEVFRKVASFCKISGLRGKHIDTIYRQINVFRYISIMSVIKVFNPFTLSRYVSGGVNT